MRADPNGTPTEQRRAANRDAEVRALRRRLGDGALSDSERCAIQARLVDLSRQAEAAA
jgi:hypothetical protein